MALILPPLCFLYFSVRYHRKVRRRVKVDVNRGQGGVGQSRRREIEFNVNKHIK